MLVAGFSRYRYLFPSSPGEKKSKWGLLSRLLSLFLSFSISPFLLFPFSFFFTAM